MSPTSPIVSVIVPVYNGERTIGACLDALLSQSLPQSEYEVIVVDNNSTDATRDIVQRFEVTLLEETERQSSYAARNRGIAHAKGEIIAFTDADCIADSCWLAELIEPFADPEIGGVGGRVLDSEPQSEVEAFIKSMSMFTAYESDATFLPVLLAGSTAYRQEHLSAVQGFNDHLYTAGDVDLSWRVQLTTKSKIAYVPSAIVHHVHRSDLKSMAHQYRRHGFGEIFLDAMYFRIPGYKRTPRRQLLRMLSQQRALLTYSIALLFRNVKCLARNCESDYRKRPYYLLVAESSNLRGKISALWATRFMRRNPARYRWDDPGER